MRKRPADRVRSLDFFLDAVAEFDELAATVGIPALLRLVFTPNGKVLPHLAQFIDVIAECPVEMLEELVTLKRTGNWTPFREVVRAQRALERDKERTAALERAAERATGAGRHVA